MTAPALLLLLRLLLLILDVCGARDAALALAAAGGTLPDPVYEDAIFAYTMVRPNVTISYAALGSVPGQCHIMAPPYPAKCTASTLLPPIAVDFAASDVPLDPGDYVLNPDLQMYPTVATSVVPVYNLNADVNLTLSTAVLAQVFSGQILTWDDPRIVALNPNFSMWRVPAGQRIEVVVRDSGSGTTGVFWQALCYFDGVFAQQVGPGTDAAWSGVNITRSARPQAYVTVTPFTVSYTPYDIAVQYSLPVARLKKASGAVVTASLEATTYALLELGLTFGNNGDNASHLTAGLSNAEGDHAWPIATYTYLIMRKSRAKSNASCAAVQETANYWYWFWTSGLASSIVKSRNFTPLPAIVTDAVVARFMGDIQCGGSPVLATPQATVIAASGVSWMAAVFQKFALVYTLRESSVSASYRSICPTTEAAVEEALATEMFVAATVPWSSGTSHSGVKLVMAGVATVVVSQYNITLDLPTLAAILDGNITTWLHPAILQLNGGVVQESDGTFVSAPSPPIVLLRGPPCHDTFLANTLRMYVPTFGGAAWAAARSFSSEDLLRAALSATPYSLGISALVGSFDSNLLFARLRRPGGPVVAPSWRSVQACATTDVYDAGTGDYGLESSGSPDCYLLASAVYVTVHKSQCSMATDPQHTAAVAFLSWLLLLPSLGEALKEQQVAPLALLTPANATNQKALATISCSTPSTANLSTNWLPIFLGVLISVLGVSLILTGLWVWKSTADMRALRRQFANDNVAQECAAAIASFDLEALEWLKSVKNPNRIQRSFLQIIHMLTELRPFIPDQLLASLRRNSMEVLQELGDGGTLSFTRGHCSTSPSDTGTDTDTDADTDANTRTRSASESHSGGEEGERKEQEEASRDGRKTEGSGSGSGSESEEEEDGHRWDGSSTSLASSLASQDSAIVRRAHSPPVTHMEGPTAHWEGVRRYLAASHAIRGAAIAPGRRRKTVVFMYVRFGFAASALCQPQLPQCVTALMADLVTIAKGHDATIDHVAYGFLALTWGVAGSAAHSHGSAKATMAALEMAQLRQRPGYEGLLLRVAVTQGGCEVSAASAAGHRFFIVAGKDVLTARDAVWQDVMAKCKCEVLISQAVYQEAQYAVECMPRLWFSDVLLWEPRHPRQSAGPIDEWMYDTSNRTGGGRRFSAHVLHAVFLLARSEVSQARLQHQVRRLRLLHASELSPQDLAALQHLEATGPAGSPPQHRLDRDDAASSAASSAGSP